MACTQSQCVVSKCKEGLVPSGDKTKCVPSALLVGQPGNDRRQTNTIKDKVSALLAAVQKLRAEATSTLPAPVPGVAGNLVTLPRGAQAALDTSSVAPIVQAAIDF
ncbi:hypothetical protein H0H87_003114, partial [Tephrocybe sp. NHM501043]